MRYFSKLIVGLALLFCALPALAQSKATQALTLTVNSGTLSFLTPTALPDGQTGLAYTGVSLAVTGGSIPYSFAVTTGALPAGISLSSSGVLSGTPTAVGANTFTITVADSETPSVQASKQFTLNVRAPLNITTSSLPAATVGTAYSANIAVTGGVSPYTCSVSAGSLPAGLALTTSGSNCVLSGTPTASGSFSFTLQVVDSATSPAAMKVNIKD